MDFLGLRWRAIGTEQLPDLAVGVEALKVPKGVIPDILVASCGVQKLPANVKLMVGLHGLCVASAKFVQTNGGESWCLAFKKATNVKRSIFASAGLQAKQAKAFDALKDACSAAGSKWTFSTDLRAYQRRRATAFRNNKMAEVFLICTKQERQQMRRAKIKCSHIFTVASLAEKLISFVDSSRSIPA